jgi:hypothetical protein
MIVKTYLDKTNTIIKDSSLNTGLNPIAELYYGLNDSGEQVFSRFLFHFDLEERLQALYDDNTIGRDLKHVLKMTNTGIFENDLGYSRTGDGKRRTSSFDLVILELDKPFRQGTGYDYNAGNGATINTTPSNWLYAKAGDNWTIPGAVENITGNVVATQSFDAGDENIEIDITELVNSYLSGAKVNNGLCLAFHETIETLESEELQYVGFFTPQTQTFFEPYLETKPTSQIKDDRYNFYINKENKLYLYVNAGGSPANLDALPTASINGTQYEVTHERKGVYSITVTLVKDIENGIIPDSILNDVWSNIIINGNSRPDITMKFHLRLDDEYFSIGNEEIKPVEYKITTSGLKYDEIIDRGEVRKVYVNPVKPYTVNEVVALEKIEYQISIKEGEGKHIVSEFTQLDNTGLNNFFLLDTLSYLPNTYYIDIKYSDNMNVRIDNDVIRFTVK